MKQRGMFLKLFLDNLLVTVVIIALAGLFAYERLDANYQRQSRLDQDRLTHIATEHFQELWPLDATRLDEISKSILHDPSARLTVIAADGTVLGDSSTDPHAMMNHKTADRPEVLAALSGTTGNDERRSETIGIQYRYAAMPVMHEGHVVAAVRVAMPIKGIAEGQSVLRGAIIWSIVAGTVAAVVLGLLTSWIWYAPLRRITQTAKRMASGDLSSKATVRGKGLDDLARALNEMRDSLGKYLGQIASQNQDFQAVLANLQEGVIATSAQGRVVLMNQAAGDLFSADPLAAAGNPLQIMFPFMEILEFHDLAVASREPIVGQFELDVPGGRRSIEVDGVKVPPGPSNIACLLVMRDVTDLVAATAMKAHFVANASHELRTPLATIRAAVDSLAEADPGDRKELAKLTGVLDRHVARLEDMTKDLLDLHMAESAKFPLRLQDIALGDLAEWSRMQFVAGAQTKGLTLMATARQPQHQVRSDRKLLELILRNLIDNAIKFTPAGGRVECIFDATDQGAVFRVSDTGCGIKPQDQGRVFERFFQSDSARAGDSKTRGTGLGLAIVKHAAERLGAKIELTSELGHGTTVTLLLPVAGASRT